MLLDCLISLTLCAYMYNLQELARPNARTGPIVAVESIGYHPPLPATASHPRHCQCTLLPSLCGGSGELPAQVQHLTSLERDHGEKTWA